MIFKKKKKKEFKNIKYENIDIKTKKRSFSKIEIDPFTSFLSTTKKPISIRLKEYIFGVIREISIIRWVKRKKLFNDYRIIIFFILSLLSFFLIIDLLFILFRSEGII